MSTKDDAPDVDVVLIADDDEDTLDETQLLDGATCERRHVFPKTKIKEPIRVN